MKSIPERIAAELSVRIPQVDAAIDLLDAKASVPFIARYRKEATGGLDDTQLRLLEERVIYLRELEERRAAVLKSIEEQGKLTPELAGAIAAAETKARLEDLYLPYKPKRRTKGQAAREAGLEPLALALLEDPSLTPERAAAPYVDADKGIADAGQALEGARWILVEKFAEDPELVGGLRQWLWDRAEWKSSVVPGKEEEGSKFADYFNASEPVNRIPSHRILALLRGRREGMLRVGVAMPEAEVAVAGPSDPERRIAARFGIANQGRPAEAWLQETVRWTWKSKLFVHLELDVEQRLREAAEAEAIRVFGTNLKDLLLAPPAGHRVTMGLDPGIRTGVKVAVVDGTGKLLDTVTVYPHQPRNDWEGALRTLGAVCRKHGVQLIAIGNGTASRETDKLAADLMAKHPELPLTRVVVSEAGASVYSASELGAKEFPDLDVSLRGAVSIARRLQDPLAELVRIDPKAIGVGQYQHDVNQVQLARKLDGIVEDCVNAVGADVNTASAPLLARISGLSGTLAQNIVTFRNEQGAFRDRRQILKVPRLGERTFQQAGVPTVRDILSELEKPGRDPRPEFRMAAFKDGVQELRDLQPGMQLEGVVTNVANFGAFVDIGVHQDGLVHVSQLADRFVKDPREIVKPGDIVTVKVLEVDLKRKRISLTMRLRDEAGGRPAATGGKPADRPLSQRDRQHMTEKPKAGAAKAPDNALAAAFSKAGLAPRK